MRVEKKNLTTSGSVNVADTFLGDKADLVFYFGNREKLEGGNVYQTLQKTYPNSIVLGCSTGGEIFSDEVFDDSVVSLAVDFEKTELKHTSASIEHSDESFSVGVTLGSNLKGDNLKGIFVLSDGLNVNGSALSQGIMSGVGKSVPIMGGLAGDGAQFEKTLVGMGNEPTSHQVVAVGFYGEHIHFGHGSAGGWDIFGPERIITKSKDNVVFEIDGKPALDIYKSYLGKLAEQLPSSALLFPLTIWPHEQKDSAVVRTILSVDEKEQSMTFAGDVPEGYTAQLMRGFIPRLVEGAGTAATQSKQNSGNRDAVALLVSCIGRKLLLGQRISEETENVLKAYDGLNYHQAGFYSYGEICPNFKTGASELHNQTMTITTFYED